MQSVIHMRTLHTGPDELLVGVKIAVAPDLSIAGGGPDRSTPREASIRAVVPSAKWIYVEPDIERVPSAPSAAGDATSAVEPPT